MTLTKYLKTFNWDNFHYTCSNCNQPVEYGKEDFHKKYKCNCFITKQQDLSMTEKRKLGYVMGNKLRFELMYEQKGRCGECGIEEWRIKKRLHAHRITKGVDGGLYLKDNVILLCPKCHRKRHK